MYCIAFEVVYEQRTANREGKKAGKKEKMKIDGKGGYTWDAMVPKYGDGIM